MRQIAASKLLPGHILAGDRTVVRTYVDTRTPRGKINVVLERSGRQYRCVWNRGTKVRVM